MPTQRLHLMLPKSERPKLFRTELKISLSLSLILGAFGIGGALRAPGPEPLIADLPAPPGFDPATAVPLPAAPPVVIVETVPPVDTPPVVTAATAQPVVTPIDDGAAPASRAFAVFRAPNAGAPDLAQPSWPSRRPRIALAPPAALAEDTGGVTTFAVASSRRPALRPETLAALTAEAETETVETTEEAVLTAGLGASTVPRVRPAALLARLTNRRAVDEAVAADAVASRALPAPGALPAHAPEIQTVAFTPNPAPVLRGTGSNGCSSRLTRDIPRRSPTASNASRIVQQLGGAGGSERDTILTRELLAGNMPSFLRQLTPVAVTGKRVDGQQVTITICVTPDYLAVGSNADYFRVPLGLPAAALVADRFGFMLPTTRMVDVIYQQAGVRLAPAPMAPGAAMTSTNYFLRHNQTVEGQLRGRTGTLVAGIKKDLVLSERLRRNPGRVAIYGWHRTNGTPIQPLSTVHGAYYADYSHGVRLVSRTAFVDGRAVALAEILSDANYAGILSKEGPIRSPDRLMAALYR